jgi:hypothetical protein
MEMASTLAVIDIHAIGHAIHDDDALCHVESDVYLAAKVGTGVAIQ